MVTREIISTRIRSQYRGPNAVGYDYNHYITFPTRQFVRRDSSKYDGLSWCSRSETVPVRVQTQRRWTLQPGLALLVFVPAPLCPSKTSSCGSLVRVPRSSRVHDQSTQSNAPTACSPTGDNTTTLYRIAPRLSPAQLTQFFIN